MGERKQTSSTGRTSMTSSMGLSTSQAAVLFFGLACLCTAGWAAESSQIKPTSTKPSTQVESSPPLPKENSDGLSPSPTTTAVQTKSVNLESSMGSPPPSDHAAGMSPSETTALPATSNTAKPLESSADSSSPSLNPTSQPSPEAANPEELIESSSSNPASEDSEFSDDASTSESMEPGFSETSTLEFTPTVDVVPTELSSSFPEDSEIDVSTTSIEVTSSVDIANSSSTQATHSLLPSLSSEMTPTLSSLQPDSSTADVDPASSASPISPTSSSTTPPPSVTVPTSGSTTSTGSTESTTGPGSGSGGDSGGLSSGGKAAVGIIVIVCILAAIGTGVICYKRYTHRSFRALLTSTVQYKTYKNSTYKDDEIHIMH